MKQLISAVALAAVIGAGQLAAVAPAQAAGPRTEHSDKASVTYKQGKKLPGNTKRERVNERDYKRYGLKTPPRGYQWVKVDDKFMMIAITSGIIGAIFGAIAAQN